jgi:hypothetical protein
MPTVSHIGVSRKIASDEERQRLKRILVHERGEASGGFIVRTAAEGASEEELRADLRFLITSGPRSSSAPTSKSPALIYHDLSLIERILRDQVSSNFSSIWVDSEADYERIVRFLNRFSPTLVRRVKLYTKETPLFEHFGIQDEISKALRSKVWLKSGGSIVINQTEALVAIDINTGKYVGKSARLEDTIVKTNLDAVPEIVRQIRLRDLGGIIVIDFIDMDERKNRFKVMAALEEALKSDRAPTKVLQFNDFGLVAITRKRVKQSLERTSQRSLPHLPGHRHGQEPDHGLQRDLHRAAQDEEALRRRRRSAARQPGDGEGAQSQQRQLAHRIRGAGRQEHPGQERRHAASGAVRHSGSWSHVAGEAGGGFNAPVGNDTSSAGNNPGSTSASGTYGGPYLTYGGNFTGGLGLRFSPRLSLLGEYQFIDDKLPGAFIAAVGTQGGHAHIWSMTLDPVIDLFPKAINSVYVTGGGGFYRKVTSFTEPEEGEECYYYCGIVVENQTVYHFSSNQGGVNFGAGFTHRLGGTYGDGQMKLYAEVRYLWIDTPPVTAYNGTGRTEAIPITLGVRW